MKCPRCGSQWAIFRFVWLALAGLIAGPCALFSRAANIEGPSSIQITNLADLGQIDNASPRIISVRLEGAVWWGNPWSGRVILADNSGVEQLELDWSCQIPRSGDRLRLEGSCLASRVKDAVKLVAIPVVDNDYRHEPAEKSGSVFLEAGKHPIRATWFICTAETNVLEVTYEGPDLPRQPIADSALFRATIDSSNGTTNYLNGLDYRSCQGVFWSLLPDLNHLTAVKSGVAANFDVSKRARNAHVGLMFNGYLEITRAGLYTFYTKSADGSRLFVGKPSISAQTAGQVPLPSPRPFAAGLPPPGTAEYFRTEFEGTITFVDRIQDVLELEVSVGADRMQVRVAEVAQSASDPLPQQRIRCVGVGRYLLDMNRRLHLGEVFVQDRTDIQLLYTAPEEPLLYPITPIGSLTGIPQTNLPTLVRVRGTLQPLAAGGAFALEDTSGKILLDSVGTNYLRGQFVEVRGLVIAAGAGRVLRCVSVKPASEVPEGEKPLVALTKVEEIYQLSDEQAGQGQPVKLRGVATSIWPYEAIVLQDQARAIFVSVVQVSSPQAGDYCEIEGITAAAAFAPYVVASRIRNFGSASMPAPMRPTWDQLLNGNIHSKYVELEGVVTRYANNSITLLTRDGLINVRLNPMRPNMPTNCENARVLLRGCVISDWNRQSPYLEVGNLFIDQSAVDIVEPAPADIFDARRKAVSDLLRFDPHAGALQRVKVSGQIVYQRNSECFLVDGQNGLRLMLAENISAEVYDRVEAVGFPDWSGMFPFLREAVVRRLGPEAPPAPRKLETANLLQNDNDSMWVQVEGVLVGATRDGERTVLEMQNGLQRFAAVLEGKTGWPDILEGSRLELTGIYVGTGRERAAGRPVSSFHLLLGSPSGVHVLARPPWWNLRRSLLVLTVTSTGLILALTWVRMLRKRVELRTRELRQEVLGHERTEAHLNEQTQRLKVEIQERNRAQLEVERIHRELVEASRQAGRAEVAIGVLHNVGNVLNSVNVSTTLISERIRALNSARLSKVAELMQSQGENLGRFIATDERGRHLPQYLAQLAQHLNVERDDLLKETTSLAQGVEHIKNIVAMQQTYATSVGVLEDVALSELVEDALTMHSSAYQRDSLKVVRYFEPLPPVSVDKHKVMQILVNLLQNAQQACSEHGLENKEVTVRIRKAHEGFVQIEVTDNGVGIASENLTRIFAQGFTTRKNGHGFALHSAALAATEMSGSLTARSGGPGRGATFVLELPMQCSTRPAETTSKSDTKEHQG